MMFKKTEFIYRKISRIAPCVLPGIGQYGLPLSTKYDVASARDVFLSAHYWRIFDHLDKAPEIIVDLGSHCGHFSIAANILIKEKFCEDRAKYILVDPVQKLARAAERNLKSAGISNFETHIGLVGKIDGTAFVSLDPKNLLKTAACSDSNQVAVSEFVSKYVNLRDLLPPNAKIDILKIDIEGSEYEFVDSYPDLIEKTELIAIEAHGTEEQYLNLIKRLESLGHHEVSQRIRRGSEMMALFKKGARRA